MARGRIVRIGLALAALAVGAWYWVGTSAGARLRVENYPQVRGGLSLTEVEELLGGPPGNYGRYAYGSAMMTCEGYSVPPGSVERIWCDDAARFEIYFDTQGRVVGLHQRARYEQFPSGGLLTELLGRVSRLLGL